MLSGFNLRLAWRGFRRRPAGALLAVAVLALGQGGALAVFSALYTVLLKPLPYRQPERLVVIHEELPGLGMKGMSVSVPVYGELCRRGGLFEEVAAYYHNDLTLTGAGYARHLDAVNASWRLFPLLGVEPQLGRTFTAAEDQPSGARVAVLSDKLWREAFGADRAIVGRKITLDGAPVEVIGVLPARFAFPYRATQVWVPLALAAKPFTAQGWQGHWLRVVARRAGGGNGSLQELSAELTRRYPEVLRTEYRWSVSQTPLQNQQAQPMRRWLYLAFGAVLCVLGAACANVAALLLLRAASRRGELSIRAALGASRARLVGGILAESLLLAGGGCAAGFLLAVWAIAAINRWSPVAGVSVDPAALGFAVLLAAGSGVLSGLLPALAGTRASLLDALKSAGSPTVAGGGSWGKRVLTAGQVAVALALLTSGITLTRSFLRILDSPTGFRAEGVFCGVIQLPERSLDQRRAAADFFARLQPELGRLPAVERASGGVWLPFSSGNTYSSLRVVERPLLRPQPAALSNSVLPGYFEALGIPLLAGRTFTPADGAPAEPVAIVDREFARRFLPGADPVGMHLLPDGGKPQRIVGVVGSVKTAELEGGAGPFVYVPFAQAPSPALMIAVRTRPGVEASAVAGDVRKALAKLRGDVALFETATLEERVAASVKIQRFVTGLLDGFAAAGVLLAALGLYGVLATAVERRRRELAIRMALGARPVQVAAVVAQSGARTLLAGVAAGIAASLAAGRLIESLLFGVRAINAISLGAAVISVLAVAAAAFALPLRRALTADPAAALKEE